MGFEPRMRGRRFGRPARKKSARERREQQGAATFYEEPNPIDASKVCSATLNSLQHLGNQRFALSPYYEHFQRWIKDITALLSEFESQLPDAVDQQFKDSVQKTMSDLQIALKERTDSESTASNKLSEAQRQVTAQENELSRLDREYKTRTHETRKQYEQASEKLSREIKTLEAERMRILHSRPTIFRKLFRRSEGGLEESTSALQSKRNAFNHRKEGLTKELEKLRIEYENKREQGTQQLNALRAQVVTSKGSKLDDALEIRVSACEEIRREVNDAVDRLLSKQDSTPTDEKT